MSDVKISEESVVKRLRLKEQYRTSVMTAACFLINGNKEIEEKDFEGGFPMQVAAYLDKDCRFFAILDLMTYKLKVVLWVGPNAPQAVRALYASCGDEMASIGSFPLVTISTQKEMDAAFDTEARNQAYRSTKKPILRVPIEELIEYQPTRTDVTYAHRRFANLFWIKQTDGNLKLNRCRSDQAMNGAGQPVSLAEANNEALHLLADGIDVSGIVMIPGGQGLALSDAQKSRVWRDPSGGGCRTEASEDEKEKVNAWAMLKLERGDSDKDNWTLTASVGADAFKWIVFWFSWGHSYNVMCKVFRQSDWNAGNLNSPVLSASTSGVSNGSKGVGLSFDKPLGVNTGRYVWIWAYTRASAGTHGDDIRFRSDLVVVNGEVVIDTST